MDCFCRGVVKAAWFVLHTGSDYTFTIHNPKTTILGQAVAAFDMHVKIVWSQCTVVEAHDSSRW